MAACPITGCHMIDTPERPPRGADAPRRPRPRAAAPARNKNHELLNHRVCTASTVWERAGLLYLGKFWTSPRPSPRLQASEVYMSSRLKPSKDAPGAEIVEIAVPHRRQ